jgi:hypothetical protein
MCKQKVVECPSCHLETPIWRLDCIHCGFTRHTNIVYITEKHVIVAAVSHDENPLYHHGVLM